MKKSWEVLFVDLSESTSWRETEEQTQVIAYEAFQDAKEQIVIRDARYAELNSALVAEKERAKKLVEALKDLKSWLGDLTMSQDPYAPTIASVFIDPKIAEYEASVKE